jgi:hypothetical protein
VDENMNNVKNRVKKGMKVSGSGRARARLGSNTFGFFSANFEGAKLKSYLLILKKWVGLHFGRFLRKLIWSPCQ